MTTDRDDESLRRYREASAELDERPSASARAAILAAAARHVVAKPEAADAPRPVHRRRWPLAAAATVLLSTLAVLLASRTGQEMPVFTAPAERASERVAEAPQQAKPMTAPNENVEAAPAPAIVAPGGNAAGSFSTPARLKKAAPADLAAQEGALQEDAHIPAKAKERSEAQRSNVSPPVAAKESGRSADTASGEARRAAPAVPPPPPSAPPLALPAPAATVPSVGAAASGERTEESAKPQSAASDRAARRDAAHGAQGAMRQEPTAKEAERSAEEWLERILKLRREGRHAQADAELKLFRERYPAVQVPAAALPPATPASGTR